jgi:D-alanine-D-alanine ligase
MLSSGHAASSGGAASPDSPPSRPRLAVLFGGRSSEHAISCVSAGSVLAALQGGPWEIVPIGITRSGRWVLPPDDQRYTIVDGVLPEVTDGEPVVLPGDATVGGYLPQGGGPAVRLDAVFPVLHGPWGEDGTIQGLLDMAGLPYVGSGVFASAAAMDKAHMKALLRAAGLPVGAYAVLGPEDDLSAAERERLGLPVFVKPARGGSSVGITKVNDWDELGGALGVARESDPKVIVEAMLTGREVECGVLGAGGSGTAADASLPAEIHVSAEFDFYDFAAKYLSDATTFDVPAQLPGDVSDEVRRLAVRAFEALDCAGLARVDFFVLPDGAVVVNEVNTMPGFTPVSMFPRMWAATGLDYPKLVTRLVEYALERGSDLRR